MKQQDNFEEYLSRQLRANRPYLDDEGFTDQVMRALPTSERSGGWRVRTIAALPVLVIGLAIIAVFPFSETVIELWQWFANPDLTLLLKTGAGISAGILLACFGWLAREMNMA